MTVPGPRQAIGMVKTDDPFEAGEMPGSTTVVVFPRRNDRADTLRR